MQISREKFLFLVTAIAQSSCGPEPPLAQPPAPLPSIAQPPIEVAVAQPIETSAPETSATAEVAAPETSAEPVGTADPAAKGGSACSNDVGAPSCSQVKVGHGPSCEGFAGECASTVDGSMGFRPRVAEAITSCWAKRGAAACSAGPKIACIKEAVKQACPDAAVVPRCQAILASCAQAKKKVKYTQDQCVTILSSVSGRDREDAVKAMSPMGEGCTLSFVLPYYPFQLGWK